MKIKLTAEVLLRMALQDLKTTRQRYEAQCIRRLGLEHGELIRESRRELSTLTPRGTPRIEHLLLWRNRHWIWETTKYGRVKSLQSRQNSVPMRSESTPAAGPARPSPEVQYRRRRIIKQEQ